MGMMADVIRGEVLYHQGGFYFDFNFQWFRKSFDDWRTYKIKPDQCLVGDEEPGTVAAEKGHGLVADCAERYPSYMLGTEHSDIGGSWAFPSN
ncbi:unnamed protein product [Sphagnum balticum]